MSKKTTQELLSKTFSKTFSEEQALQEASRCLLCEDAPCERGCPTSTPVKEFIRNIRFKNFLGAYHLIKTANVLGTACARICNADETCKKYCTSHKLVSPIQINKLQQFVCDMHVGVATPLDNLQKTGKQVAIIGGGPAGVSAAFDLARNGVEVTIFEKSSKLGGVATNGIPNYRLPDNIFKEELQHIINHPNITVKLNSKISSIKEIESGSYSFDATIIATGLTKTHIPNIPGTQLKGIFSSKDILLADKTNCPITLGKDILVIGGGNSAFDVAQAAQSNGTSRVTILYRRSEKELPAWGKEIEVAKFLGITIRLLTNIIAIEEEENKKGKLIAKCQIMDFQNNSSTVKHNRRNVVPLKNAVLTLSADSIIFATGESLDDKYFKDNKIKLNNSFYTNLKNIFAIGDLINTDKSVVHAVESGKQCSKEVLNYLNTQYIQLNKTTHYYSSDLEDLSTTFCGVTFENPFILAAAPPTDDLDMVRAAFNAGWAGAVLKTTSIEENIVSLKYPMMEGISLNTQKISGLGNIDLISEHHIDIVEKRVKQLKQEFPKKIVIASIMGEKKEDWQILTQRLESAGVDIIECSFSCPQGTLGDKAGFMLGQSAPLVKTVAGWVKSAAKRVPVVIKITPQVTDIVEIAKAIKDSGADGICASNSIPSLMGIDINNFIPKPNVAGFSTYSGYSGAAIKPITLRNIAEIKKHVDIPITGTGGPVTWSDAIELMLVGASNVQFCTAVMQYGFDIINDLKSGLNYYMKKNNIKSINDIIGKSLPYITTHDKLIQKDSVVSKINQDSCITCGACFRSCSDGGHNAIHIKDTKDNTDSNNRLKIVKIDPDKCVGCALCIAVCPTNSINLTSTS